MIIKIQCETGNEKAWVIYDNIERIRYYRNNEPPISIPDIMWLRDGKEEEGVTLKMVMNIKNDPRENRLIVTNGSTYLCNDEGKTIEKLF